MSTPLPRAISEGTLTIGGMSLRVINLDNGQRVIDADDAEAFFAALHDGMDLSDDDAAALAKALSA